LKFEQTVEPLSHLNLLAAQFEIQPVTFGELGADEYYFSLEL
jgi:hypothetical protein